MVGGSVEREKLERLFPDCGCADYAWIEPREIVVSQWVRLKCTFGCDTYGKNASCPPNTPSVQECRRLFDEYRSAVVLHFQGAVADPSERAAWSREISERLSALEREVFLSGHPKAFVLFMDCCRLCPNCVGTRDECRDRQRARPSAEGMAVDVFSTVRKVGLPIEVLTDPAQTMNRYAFLLVD
jgi:predicted metal-binding protein